MQNYGSFPPSSATADDASVRPPKVSALARLFLSAGGKLVDATSATERLRFDDLLPLEPLNTAAASLARVDAAGFPLDDLSPRGALRGLWRTHGTTLLWCVVGHAFTAATTILAPIVVQRVVVALDQDHVDTATLRVWLALFFATRVLAVLVDTHVFLALNHVSLRLMAALRSVLFRKALRSQLHPATTAPSLDVSNLATSDAACCLAAIQQLTKLGVVPVHILVTIYLLYSVLGPAAFPGIVVIVLSLAANYRIARIMGNAYASLMTLRDARMRMVHEAFGAMEHVKLNSWEQWFQSKLFKQRDRELVELQRYVYASAASTFVLWGSPLAVSAISFACYALVLGRELTAARVFTATVLFNVLRGPLQDAPTIVQSLLQSRVSLARIRAFLGGQEFDPISVNRTTEASSTTPYAIDIRDASFAWNENAALALRGLTLQVRKGDFVLVTGDVGAGKTALCLALLGELHRLSPGGVAEMHGTVAYVAQTPWIQHGTLQDNIVFGRHFDAQRYHRVVHACCLEEDFALFPAGDHTEIGERGVNLSGGQKMRLALARACYADADIYVLDAPLAPVDVPVQRQLLERCLCALLATKTVVLTSHHPHELLERLNVVNVHVQLENGLAVSSARRDAVMRSTVVQLPTKRTEDLSLEQRKPTLNKPLTGRLVADEEREIGDVSVGVWANYFRAVGGVGTLVLLGATQLLWQLCQISSDVWLSFSTGHELPSSRIVTVYSTLAMATATLVALRGLVVSQMGLRASKTLFRSMVQGLLHAPMRFFDTTPIGRVLNRFVDDILVLDRSIPTSLGLFLGVATATACALITAAVGIGLAGVLLVPLAALYLVIARRCVRAFCELMRLRKIGLAPILSHLAQSQRGVATLRAFGDPDVARAIREFEARVDKNSTLWHSEIVLNQWFIQRLQFLGCAVLAVVLGAVYGFRDQFSAGAAGLVLTYTLSVNSALTTLVRVWARSENSMVSVERVLAYSNLEPEEDASTAALGDVGSESWPSKGHIEFTKVQFAYTRGSAVSPDDLVLRDVSFTVRGGESIGVIGRTGAGKSSLTRALFRLNELVGGRIRIDGVDIARVPLTQLRMELAIIPQSPVLLAGSLRETLDPNGRSSDEVLLRALDDVQLTSTLLALRGPGDHSSILDLALHAEGDNLSVGQRQLLCLARVLLRKTRIVVLDEATASVDTATEKSIAETLHRELRSVTRLTIAHRLATVRHADRILVMEKGRVVSYDTPQKLLDDGDDVAALLRDAQQE